MTALRERAGTLSTPAVARIRSFLDREQPETPCLVVDLDTVVRKYLAIRYALPAARIFYAVKANPAPEVIDVLVDVGAGFDVASIAELELCLQRGAHPGVISYGNTIKKARDIAHAYRRGVRLFVSDSEQDVRAIAEHAPGAKVMIRIAVNGNGSTYPFGRKFGCTQEMATDLFRLAHRCALIPLGVAFHPGSQQLDPHGWDEPIADAAAITARLAAEGIELTTVNLGGGFPAAYRDTPPPLAEYAAAIGASVARHFGAHPPRVMIEPGRAVVAEAGLIRSEVVLVARKCAADERRWVYLDIGRYGGLAETEGEAIAYPLETSLDGGPVGPAVIAGPTCDGDDVVYQRTRYELPLGLRCGDHVDLMSAGAYTSSYSSVSFNGFGPLPTYCLKVSDTQKNWRTR